MPENGYQNEAECLADLGWVSSSSESRFTDVISEYHKSLTQNNCYAIYSANTIQMNFNSNVTNFTIKQ